MAGTVNAQGLVELRRTITEMLAAADESDFARAVPGRRTMVRELVARVVAAYEAVRDGNLDEADGRPLDDVDASHIFDLPPEMLLARFEDVATAVEERYAADADQRWTLSRTDFERADGTMGLFLQQLAYDLYSRGCQIAAALGKPFTPPAEATEAAGAALVWWLSGKVERPVEVRLGADSLMLGAGEPVATITTDLQTLIAVSAGTDSVEAAERRGAWSYAGDASVRPEIEASLRLDWSDPEIEVAAD